MDQFLGKWKPIPKVWVPFATGVAGVISWFIVTGEWNREMTAALVPLGFAAGLGYAIPNGPVQHTHDSDEIVEAEMAARAQYIKDQTKVEAKPNPDSLK